MARSMDRKMIELGIRAGEVDMYREDQIWSRYSNDKVDIGEQLARVIRTLGKAMPLGWAMRALSIGSSAEPQFRILETAFNGGLYLLDLEEAALDIVKERVKRQHTSHVTTIRADYNKIFPFPERTRDFLKNKLNGRKVNLITLHHSLYYCEEKVWHAMIRNLYGNILAGKGAMHMVLMASESGNDYTTTWLYNHFVGKYFGHHNGQSLLKLKKDLMKDPLFAKAQILSRTNTVRFFVNDFGKFMAVVWMILLYPFVHKYTPSQKEEITEFVYRKFWRKKRPLLQQQDHLAVYRGIDFKGLV